MSITHERKRNYYGPIAIFCWLGAPGSGKTTWINDNEQLTNNNVNRGMLSALATGTQLSPLMGRKYYHSLVPNSWLLLIRLLSGYVLRWPAVTLSLLITPTLAGAT